MTFFVTFSHELQTPFLNFFLFECSGLWVEPEVVGFLLFLSIGMIGYFR